MGSDIYSSDRFKAEISTLQGIAADSTKMLTDKLTLAHEIASMKPELDHLRCQVMSHQGVLSEKLSLQRQLNTLQIELENEKRAAKRVADREQDASNGKHLKTRLAETQADLAREKRDKQKLEREAQRTSTETENRIFALSSRLDTLRSKLHASEEQLKAKQSETIPPRSQKAESSNGDSRTTKKNPSKGRAAKADESTVIGTPGQSLAEARTKRKTAVVGEKSFFSTTPYLNRAASVAPSSPALSSDQSEHKNTGCGRNQEGSTDEHEEEHMSAKERQPAGVKHGHFLAFGKNRPHGENTIPKTNFGLTQIIEEGDDQAKKNCQPLRRASEEQLTSDIAPKKRRLLTGGMGSTLFDEEESGNVIKRTKLGGNIRLGGSRRVGPIGGRTSTQASAGGLFGAISPLKKNRKILVA